MKKILLSLLVIVSIIMITGCNSKKEEQESKKENNDVMKNSVVLYFSATGTTKKIAERIASKSGSELIEIIPKVAYTSDDLNYNSDCRANREQNDSNARPEIKNTIDISKYDVIYLGYPIWWGTNPKIILTLLDKYDFTGKVIFPFCTSGSSSIDKSIEDLKNYNPNLNIKDGKRFSSNNSQNEINDFVNRSKIEMNTINEDANKVNVNIDGNDYILNLEDNVTAKKLYELAPFDVTMDELNGNEKYIYLSSSFPINPYKPGHIEKGDVMLFDNSCLVIFYKSFDTTYSYTKIGHIDNLPDLGSSSISVKFTR
jgi:flavodoxin